MTFWFLEKFEGNLCSLSFGRPQGIAPTETKFFVGAGLVPALARTTIETRILEPTSVNISTHHVESTTRRLDSSQ
jgi:hypothetical protein